MAKWQRLDGYVAGLYAIKVSGQLPDEIRQVIEDEYRIQYIPWVFLLSLSPTPLRKEQSWEDTMDGLLTGVIIVGMAALPRRTLESTGLGLGER